MCALAASSACSGTTPEMSVGVVYAKHPRAYIVAQSEPHGVHSSYIACDSNSQMYLVRVNDENGSYVEDDLAIPNIPCGAKLQELQRLAEIGKKHDDKK